MLTLVLSLMLIHFIAVTIRLSMNVGSKESSRINSTFGLGLSSLLLQQLRWTREIRPLASEAATVARPFDVLIKTNEGERPAEE